MSKVPLSPRMITSASIIIAIGQPGLSGSCVQPSNHDAMLWLRSVAVRKILKAQTDFLVVRRKAGEWQTIFEQHKRDILIMDAVDAISKITCCFRDTNGLFFHSIRLPDNQRS